MTDRRKRKSFQGLCLGFGAIVCALACGADEKAATSAGPGSGAPTGRPDVANAPPNDGLSPECDDTPQAAGCPGAPGPDTRSDPPPPSERGLS